MTAILWNLRFYVVRAIAAAAITTIIVVMTFLAGCASISTAETAKQLAEAGGGCAIIPTPAGPAKVVVLGSKGALVPGNVKIGADCVTEINIGAKP